MELSNETKAKIGAFFIALVIGAIIGLILWLIFIDKFEPVNEYIILEDGVKCPSKHKIYTEEELDAQNPFLIKE